MSATPGIPLSPLLAWPRHEDDLESHRIKPGSRIRGEPSDDHGKLMTGKVADAAAVPVELPPIPASSASSDASELQSFNLSAHLLAELDRWTTPFCALRPESLPIDGVVTLPLSFLLSPPPGDHPSAGLVLKSDCQSFLVRYYLEDVEPRITCEGWSCAVMQALIRRARTPISIDRAECAYVPDGVTVVRSPILASPSAPASSQMAGKEKKEDAATNNHGDGSNDDEVDLPLETRALLARLTRLLSSTGFAPPPLPLLDAFYMFSTLAHVPRGTGLAMDLRLGAVDREQALSGGAAYVRPRYFRHTCRLMRLRPAHVHNLLYYFYDAPQAADVMLGDRKLDMTKLTAEKGKELRAARFIAKWMALAILVESKADGPLSPDDAALLSAYRAMVEFLEEQSIAHTLAESSSLEESSSEIYGGEGDPSCSTVGWFSLYLMLTLICNLGALMVDAWIQAVVEVRREGLYKEWAHVRRFLCSRIFRVLLAVHTVYMALFAYWSYLSYEPLVFFLASWLSDGGLASLDGVVTTKVIYLAPAAINAVACLCASAAMARDTPVPSLQLRHRTQTILMLNQRQRASHLTDLEEQMQLEPSKRLVEAARRQGQANTPRTRCARFVFGVVPVVAFLGFVYLIEVEFGFRFFGSSQLPAVPRTFAQATCANLTQQLTVTDSADSDLPGCLLYHCVTTWHNTSFSSACDVPSSVLRANLNVTTWLIVFLSEACFAFPAAVYYRGRVALQRLRAVRSLVTYSRTTTHLSFEFQENINAYLLLTRDLQVSLRSMQALEPLLAFNVITMLGSTVLCGFLVITRNIHALFYFFLPFAILGSIVLLAVIYFVATINTQFADLVKPMEQAEQKISMAITLRGLRQLVREYGWNESSSREGQLAVAASLSRLQLAMLGSASSGAPAAPSSSSSPPVPTLAPSEVAVRLQVRRIVCSAYTLRASTSSFTSAEAHSLCLASPLDPRKSNWLRIRWPLHSLQE